MSETTPQMPEIQETAVPKEPFFKKYSLGIIVGLVILLGGYMIYSTHVKPTTNATIVKTDTVSAQYLVTPLGQIAASVVLKYHLSDGSIMYGVPLGMDTVKGKDGYAVMDTVRNGNQILTDTVKDKAGKPELDSLLHFKMKPRLGPKMTVHLVYRFPKYVKELSEISIH